MVIPTDIIDKYFSIDNTFEILIDWILKGDKNKQYLAYQIFTKFNEFINQVNTRRISSNRSQADLSREKTNLKNKIGILLQNEYSYTVKNVSKQDTKHWLIGCYCRLGTCEESFDIVNEFLTQENDQNIKFWALYSYINSCNQSNYCQRLIDNSVNELRTHWLSQIWLSQDNMEIRDTIINELENKQNNNLVFALSYYPKIYFIDTIINLLEKFVRNCEKDFWEDKEYWYHYNLIRITGKIKEIENSDNYNLDTICISLLKYLNCLSHIDNGPWLAVKLKVIKIIQIYSDSIQNLTISNLDNLLLSSNVNIVMNAFKVLQKSGGLERAVKSIITSFNTIYQDSLNKDEKFIIISNALKWLNRNDNKILLELENIMNSCDNNEQEIARKLIMEIGGQTAIKKLGAREQLKNKYFTIMDKAQQNINEMFQRTMLDAKNGFNIAMTMDVLIFIIGFLLLSVSGFIAIFNNNSDNWVGVGASGGTGMATVLFSMFYSKPREQVTKNVNHLMNLKIIFLAYLRELNQMDQAFSQKMIESENISESELTYFKDNISKSMNNAVQTLNKIKNNSLDSNTTNEQTPLMPQNQNLDTSIAIINNDRNVSHL